MSIAEKSFEPGTACPLDGMRVIDLSRLVSGNMATPPAPALGEHTAEMLGALGLDRAVIDGLARDGVIGLAGVLP